jgi:hypothetical protein
MQPTSRRSDSVAAPAAGRQQRPRGGPLNGGDREKREAVTDDRSSVLLYVWIAATEANPVVGDTHVDRQRAEHEG